jgi:uncharacterized membrane protein YidH (DUF202 family)
VLEIKLAYADEVTPEWLEAIVSSFDVVEVYKFSKYQHGCALLYPNALQKFPHWYGCDAVVVDVPNVNVKNGDADDMGERTESSSSFKELVRAAVATLKYRRSDGKREQTDAALIRADAPSRLRHVPVKVEPKTFFANERTLLQWLSMSILLLFLALGLLSMERGAATTVIPGTAPSGSSFGTLPSAICGLTLAPISILFMLYALWTYIVRAKRIARREPSARYDDMYGPVALVALLVVIAIATVSLTSASIDWRHM